MRHRRKRRTVLRRLTRAAPKKERSLSESGGETSTATESPQSTDPPAQSQVRSTVTVAKTTPSPAKKQLARGRSPIRAPPPPPRGASSSSRNDGVNVGASNSRPSSSFQQQRPSSSTPKPTLISSKTESLGSADGGGKQRQNDDAKRDV